MGSRNNKPGRIVKGTAKQPSLKDASGVWTLDEAMQAHRANAWPQPNLFQPVANSLRLDDSKQTTLNKEIPRSGNRKTWTFSAWIKKAGSSSFQVLFGTNTATDSWTVVRFQGQSLMLASATAGNYDCYVSSSSSFRDSSAWYHVVGVADTSNATSTNRFRLYANGVRVPIGAESTVPLNYDTYVNSSLTHRIGGQVYNGTLGSVFAGNMTEVNFIDGYAVDPSLFGKLDTNNTWVPIAYTGTYGTNGFYLPFVNAATSQTLGYDASVNGTTTYDADQDPYRGSVALHLTGNGPAGGNNNVFSDSSSNNLAITRGGTTTQGSFSPFPMQSNTPYNPAVNGASAYFNGSSDYLTVGSFPAIGTQDFTVECWVYANSTAVTGGYNPRMFDLVGIQLVIEDAAGRTCRLDFNDANSLYVTSSGVFQINQWNHIAVVRISNIISFYLNGVAQTGGTRSDNLLGGTGYIGVYRGGTIGFWNGYICGFRAIIGKGVYTAAFTPTMRPFGALTNNLITFSEDFNNAYWTPGSVTVTPSAAVAPDGNPSATKLTASSTGSIAPQIYKYPNPNLSNSTTYTLSVYAKAAEYNYIVLNNNDGLSSYRTWFNLTTGTVGTNASGNTASIVSVGNGWYRCIVYRTMAASSAANSLQGIQIANADAADTFSAISGSGVYIWGAQIEQGTSATNYTPTPANYSTAPSLLLNFANAAVVDSAGANNLITYGNSTITSSSKYGSGALYYDGSSTGFQGVPYNNSFVIGNTNYTVEFWCNLSAYGEIVGAFNLTSPYSGWLVNVGNFGAGGTIGFFHANATVNQTVNSTNTVPLNTWTHVAVVKQDNFLKMFINGRLDSGHSLTLTSTGSNQQINIGADSNSITAPTSRHITGYLDDLRVTKGVARYQSDFAPPARALPETGGKSFVTTNVNAGVVRSFTTTGTTAWTAPTDVTSVEVLVVAGGGGAGSSGGGGGAGGLIYNNSYPVTPGQTYTVTIGTGGAGGAQNAMAGTASNGTNSQFGNLVATGGGGGGNWGTNGAIGGSGGGAGRDGGSGAAGIAGQGFTGGNTGSGNAPSGGGGGGGAGGVGSAGVTNGTGNGGVGLQFGISGAPTYYAGGGGGAGYDNGTNGTGGSGIGGTGGTNASRTPTTPSTNTGSGGGGGGGGGGGADAGGAGATGIVIVRYTTTAVGNISDPTTDNLVDSPTQYGHDSGLGGEVVGNYATLNPLQSGITLSNGNLAFTAGATNTSSYSTIGVSSGKWYVEGVWTATGSTAILGVALQAYADKNTFPGGNLYSYGYEYSGYKYNNNSGVSYAATWTTGDVIGVALDLDAGTITFYKNGASQGVAFSGLQAGTYFFGVGLYNATGNINFGQRPFAYTAPAGYNALTTKNLPRPAVGSAAATPNEFFDAVTYTGNGTTQSISSLNFQPDFVWTKRRDGGYVHGLWDSVRGVGKHLMSSLTNAEITNDTDGYLSSFNSNGFTLIAGANSSATWNLNTSPYVAWCWRAGGAAVSNTAGAITSQVSANTASGFSVVTYTGTGTQASVGHGLSAAPELIITKPRNQTDGWHTYTTVIDGSMDYFFLNTTAVKGDSGLAVPTSTVFYNDGWSASYNMVAYCFHSVAGYSKIGSYTGNGSADGVFLYLGFKPKFVLIKRTNVIEDWVIVDASRNPNNVTNLYLLASSSGAEGTTTLYDFVSNGIKFRGNSQNESGSTYIYMAIADKPFGNVNGVAR